MKSLDDLLEKIKDAPLVTPCKKDGVVYVSSVRTLKVNNHNICQA